MKLQRVKYKDIEEIPRLKINQNFKQAFQGSAPAPFIGRYGYPDINIGILSPQIMGNTSNYDSPKLWNEADYKIGDIASMRYSLVNSRTKARVKQLSGRFLDTIQEVGLAKKPAELEISLKTKPQLQFKPEREIIPFGPQGDMEKARITSNPKMDTRVERVVSDTDLKSAPALISLYKKGFEESTLNKILSVGTLGLKKNRKLVPTRWSITAVDDTIGKQLISEIKDLQIGDYAVYFGGGWGNYYLLLFFPEVWSYELFETYLNKEVNPWSSEMNSPGRQRDNFPLERKNNYVYSTDYENYAGRKTYAEETAGGYYACRLSVLEKIKQLKRQHSCLALRFITPEYNVPLGVWVCRESTRKCLDSKPIKFGAENLMIKYAKNLIETKFGFDLDLLLKESKLLKEKGQQKKLVNFFPINNN